MGLSENLTEIKSKADAMIAYANDVTGGSDATLGDAIKTLADGYGQGGGSGLECFAEYEFEVDQDYMVGTGGSLVVDISLTDEEVDKYWSSAGCIGCIQIELVEKSGASEITNYCQKENILFSTYCNDVANPTNPYLGCMSYTSINDGAIQYIRHGEANGVWSVIANKAGKYFRLTNRPGIGTASQLCAGRYTFRIVRSTEKILMIDHII